MCICVNSTKNFSANLLYALGASATPLYLSSEGLFTWRSHLWLSIFCSAPSLTGKHLSPLILCIWFFNKLIDKWDLAVLFLEAWVQIHVLLCISCIYMVKSMFAVSSVKQGKCPCLLDNVWELGQMWYVLVTKCLQAGRTHCALLISASALSEIIHPSHIPLRTSNLCFFLLCFTCNESYRYEHFSLPIYYKVLQHLKPLFGHWCNEH